MATLREYFGTDFPAVMTLASTLTISNKSSPATTYNVPARVHLDFDSGTKYISYFVPSGPDSYALCEGTECKKCVLVLSSNFLSNTGWTKAEFDSVFTRQILEGSNVALPVWCGVTKQQITNIV
jgi:hypothetical protein